MEYYEDHYSDPNSGWCWDYDDWMEHVKELEAKEPYKDRSKKYKTYFYVSGTFTVAPLIYAIIPVKTEIPVKVSMTPNSINLTYNF